LTNGKAQGMTCLQGMTFLGFGFSGLFILALAHLFFPPSRRWKIMLCKRVFVNVNGFATLVILLPLMVWSAYNLVKYLIVLKLGTALSLG